MTQRQRRLQPHYMVVGYNTAAEMITVIARTMTLEDAVTSGREAPSRYYKHVTIIDPDGHPMNVTQDQ